MLARLRGRRAHRLLAVGFVAVAAACGGSDGGGAQTPERPATSAKDEAAVKRVVNRFAGADDADACELLTQGAVQRVYGGLRRCLERADRFKGGAVEITSVSFAPDGVKASADARSLDGDARFRVSLRRAEGDCGGAGTSAGDWRINGVTPAERT
jgi:hypothetical protein